MPEEPAPTTSHGSFFKRKLQRPSGSSHRRTPSASSAHVVSSDVPHQPSPPRLPHAALRPSTTSSSSNPRAARPHRRESSLSSLTDGLRENLRRRSTSLRSGRISPDPPVALAYFNPLDKRSASSTSVPTLTLSTVTSHTRSSENVSRYDGETRTPLSAPDYKSPRSGLPIPQGQQQHYHHRKDDPGRAMTTPQSAPGEMGSGPAMLPLPTGSSSPAILFNHIHDVASKRISTLDYLRKTHEGRVYWFNTLFFTRADLLKIPYFDVSKLGRRATNYLCLGLSIPAILDPNSESLIDYLRAFNSLLSEFESFQSMHSPEGTSSSFGRNKLPGMFKRGNVPKVRRGSSADQLSPLGADSDIGKSFGGTQPAYSSFNGSTQELLPGEEYSFLLTPSLPFDPDYFETFATLCDVLIDCYSKIDVLVTSPEICSPLIGDQFAKIDAKVRKILVAGVAKDFEDASRQGVRNEMTGIKKVVLGGLM